MNHPREMMTTKLIKCRIFLIHTHKRGEKIHIKIKRDEKMLRFFPLLHILQPEFQYFIRILKQR